jgi:hypothetical protein
MEIPTSMRVIFYLTDKDVKGPDGKLIPVPESTLQHKDTKRVLRDYRQLVAAIGESKALEGIALTEAFFDILGDYSDDIPRSDCCKWAARLRPWMRTHVPAFLRIIDGAYSLEMNFIIPNNYGSAREYNMDPVTQEAVRFCKQVEALNLKRGTWVYDSDVGPDELVFINEHGNAERIGRTKPQLSSPEGWSLATPSSLRVTIAEIDRQLDRLRFLREKAEKQAKGWFDHLKLPGKRA